MKNLSLCILSALVLITTLLSSCNVIEGIFKAGMGVGIFIVVAIIGIIAFFVLRSGKNKT